jgi:rRNA-processing protein FCF1
MDFLTAKHLFIDTNVLLSFYHFAGDDLEELKKLIVLLEQKKVKLYLPSQVIAEFNRNREAKIADGLKRFKEQRLSLQFPQMCRDYAEYEKLRQLQRAYETEHATLLNRLNEDITAYDLKADRITSELFRLGKQIDCSDALVGRARNRFDLGNPPGKKGSLGDALNWEALLSDVPEKSDLHFISEDRDFSSALNAEVFSGFLAEEWTKKKESTLIFYKRISAFFKEYFPDIKLATEFEKDLLIADFTNSYNFARTHSVIAKLSKYTDFTAAQVNAIVSAAVNNSQIRSIIDDPDVLEFLTSAVKGHEDLIDGENLEILRELLNPSKPVVLDDADVPF